MKRAKCMRQIVAALAGYEDALAAVTTLDEAADALIANPGCPDKVLQ